MYTVYIYIILLYICILYIYIVYIYIYIYMHIVYIYIYIYIYIIVYIYILRIFIECSNMFIIHLANVMMTFFHHVSLLRFPGCDYSLVRLSFFLSVPMWGAIGVATCISPVPKKVAHWYMCEKHVIHLHIWGVTPSFLLELSGSKNNWRIKTGLCFFHEQIHQHPRASLCQGTFQHPLLEGIGSPLARSFPFFTNWEKKHQKWRFNGIYLLKLLIHVDTLRCHQTWLAGNSQFLLWCSHGLKHTFINLGFPANYVRLPEGIIEGSLEVKLPTIWTDEKQSREEAERRERLEKRRVEEKE